MRSVRSMAWALLVMPALAFAQPANTEAKPEVTAESMAKAELDGKLAAENAPGWFGRGIAVGALGGPLGILIGYAVAANSTPELPADGKGLWRMPEPFGFLPIRMAQRRYPRMMRAELP